jgi:hypothetical protein
MSYGKGLACSRTCGMKGAGPRERRPIVLGAHPCDERPQLETAGAAAPQARAAENPEPSGPAGRASAATSELCVLRAGPSAGRVASPGCRDMAAASRKGGVARAGRRGKQVGADLGRRCAVRRGNRRGGRAHCRASLARKIHRDRAGARGRASGASAIGSGLDTPRSQRHAVDRGAGRAGCSPAVGDSGQRPAGRARRPLAEGTCARPVRRGRKRRYTRIRAIAGVARGSGTPAPDYDLVVRGVHTYRTLPTAGRPCYPARGVG